MLTCCVDCVSSCVIPPQLYASKTQDPVTPPAACFLKTPSSVLGSVLCFSCVHVFEGKATLFIGCE